MLISLAFTTLRKKEKKQNQTAVVPTQERPSSVAIVELPFNVVNENDQMISFNRVLIFFTLSISFFLIWILFSFSTTANYSFMFCFSLSFNIIPPLYFFNNQSSFKIAISLVREMFNWYWNMMIWWCLLPIYCTQF